MEDLEQLWENGDKPREFSSLEKMSFGLEDYKRIEAGKVKTEEVNYFSEDGVEKPMTEQERRLMMRSKRFDNI